VTRWLRPQWLILAAVLLLCAQCTPAPAPQDVARALGESAPLLPLYEALDALETGGKSPVALLQIGDSHTANDAFSGRMRELFQARFGDAGRGMLPPGIPFRYYRPAQVTVTAANWVTVSSFTPSAPGPFGISGLRQAASGPAEMTLQAASPAGLGRVVVEALGQPGGGTLDAAFDTGQSVSFSTGGSSGEAMWLTMPAAPAGATLTVRARGDGPVDLLSWTTTLGRRGVTYSNQGTIGATVDLIGRWDASLVKAELAWLHPALILVAFGTNEGFRDSTDGDAYRALYADRVRSLQTAAPWAAILVMGPPDGSRAATHAGATGEACPPATDGPREHVVWMVPPRLAEVREAQRAVARASGYYYWDWSAAMGGSCSMQAWARTSPPMGAPDHVHLYAPGYRATAEVLFQDIMRGYQHYRDLIHPR
jgi:lysophospholipase L1-like esterase